MANYIVYPGYGLIAPGEEESYIEGAELASLYGLEVDEYEIGEEVGQTGTVYDADHIHLLPRPDGLYRNIKTELGDNGTDYHWDRMVNPDKFHRRNRDRDIDSNRPR